MLEYFDERHANRERRWLQDNGYLPKECDLPYILEEKQNHSWKHAPVPPCLPSKSSGLGTIIYDPDFGDADRNYSQDDLDKALNKIERLFGNFNQTEDNTQVLQKAA